MEEWDKLSITDKYKYIKEGVARGLRSIKEIKKTYEAQREAIQYTHDRFPATKNIDINLDYNPNFKPKGYGDIEYLPANRDTLGYYPYSKPASMQGKSTIVYNDNLQGESLKESIALDALSHGLREQDPMYNQYLEKYARSRRNSDASRNARLAMQEDIEKNGYSDSYSDYYNSAIDGELRDLLVRDEFRESMKYAPREDLKWYGETPAQRSAYNGLYQYIQDPTVGDMYLNGAYNMPELEVIGKKYDTGGQIDGLKETYIQQVLNGIKPQYLQNTEEDLETPMTYNTPDTLYEEGEVPEEAYEGSEIYPEEEPIDYSYLGINPINYNPVVEDESPRPLNKETEENHPQPTIEEEPQQVQEKPFQEKPWWDNLEPTNTTKVKRKRDSEEESLIQDSDYDNGGYPYNNIAARDATRVSPNIPIEPTNMNYQGILNSIIMNNENSPNDPNGGYNKKEERWYPHKSAEGGASTIAYGHKLNDPEDKWTKKVKKQGYLSNEDVMLMLQDDIVKHEKKARSSYAEITKDTNNAKSFDELSNIEKAILVDFAYNTSLKSFPKFTKAIATGDADTAFKEYKRFYKDSKGEAHELEKRNNQIKNLLLINYS